jgi:hypothetical protein
MRSECPGSIKYTADFGLLPPGVITSSSAIEVSGNLGMWRDGVLPRLFALLLLVPYMVWVQHQTGTPTFPQPGDRLMPRQDRPIDSQAVDRPHKPSCKEGVVITPAGPVCKEKVHRVGPNDAVRRNPDGTYTIVPRKSSE